MFSEIYKYNCYILELFIIRFDLNNLTKWSNYQDTNDLAKVDYY